MIDEVKLLALDIKEVALITLIHAAHKLMTGRGLLAMLREAARMTVRSLIVDRAKASSIEDNLKVLDSLLTQFEPLKTASYVHSQLLGDEIRIEIRDCAFHKICTVIENFLKKRPDLQKMIQARPCAIAILYVAAIEQIHLKEYDIMHVEFGSPCRIILKEVKL